MIVSAEEARFEIRLSGAVELRCGGRLLDLGPRQRRHVLAALAVDLGRPVPIEVIIDRVWGRRAPAQARRSVHAHVTRIRRLFEQAGDDGERLRLGPLGYVLDAVIVDLHDFQELMSHGTASSLRAALRRWRGEPLTGLAGDWADRFRAVWAQHHLEAVLAWATAELPGPAPERLVGPLTDLLVEHPLHEGLSAVLMRALAATGRPAQALAVYARTRQRLVTELGTEPGAELRALHRGLLREDDSAERPPAVIPAQLPAAVRGFTGRDRELAQLDAVLAEHRDDPSTVMLAVLSGTAGVGKTALAVHWAHRVRHQFPDGQLHIDLRGYDPDRPVSPLDALARFLTALGVPLRDLPLDLDDRTARLRSELARRRVLLLLDNAASVDQVRPLLPGSSSSAVVVTSRDTLAGLVVVDGAQRLVLDLLPPADAYSLLRRLAGAAVDTEVTAAYALVELCARLPLALRVAAEMLLTRPGATVADLVHALQDRRERLSRLDAGGDSRAGVAAVFSWSLQRLPESAARMFRLLGLHPGPDVGVDAAAALVGLDPSTAGQLLDRLARSHLITAVGPDRFHMHDLLRAYAIDGVTDADTALDRLYGYYFAAATAALSHIFSRSSTAPTVAPGIDSVATARAWLEAERPNLVALAGHASQDRPQPAVDLARLLFRYLLPSYPVEALTINEHARVAAESVGDHVGRAHALLGLGIAAAQLDGRAQAVGYLRQAAHAFRELADTAGEAQAWNAYAITHHHLGDYRTARIYWQRALNLARTADDLAGQARALNNLGYLKPTLGLYTEGMDHLRESRRINQRTGNQASAAITASNIGRILAEQGKIDEALEEYETARRWHRESGNRSGEAEALTYLGCAHAARGDFARSAELHRRSLEISDAAGNPTGVVEARNGLGELALARGDVQESIRQHLTVLERGAVTAIETARAHAGLGTGYRLLGDTELATDHYRSALQIYSELGAVYADRVRAELAATLGAS
ncbi:AfsR/SARP family transcriptional regulator [Actinoplanes philippinensis]|uniref:AfsR/SARP family transcriptional regulator n=1 Tax=Actinoplanes philippinensis TaxID=35752 RepID=UPI0033FC6508